MSPENLIKRAACVVLVVCGYAAVQGPALLVWWSAGHASGAPLCAALTPTMTAGVFAAVVGLASWMD